MSPRRRAARALATLTTSLALAACGGDADGTGPLRVAAASSLKTALTEYARPYGAQLSFAGSDELAAQIRRGVKPDVFASADTELADALHAEGLLEQPVVFASNELVLAVPARSQVGRLADLEHDGIRIAIGSPGVPVGRYTRALLDRLGERRAARIRANVRSEEPAVTGIVGKLTQQAVDAGFVYRTDVEATEGSLRAITLPAALQPRVAYAAAVSVGTGAPARAREFVDGLRDAAALRNAGFLPAP